MEVDVEGKQARDPGGLTRRELLKKGGVAGIVLTLPAVGTSVDATYAAGRRAARSVRSGALPASLSKVLEAIVARLIPADARGPGAKEAGAASYIERGLVGGLKVFAALYAAGLGATDAYAKKAYGAEFAALAPANQDAVLTDLAANKATGFTPNSSAFFGLVREHTLQGMFGDPIYGGNKNFAGWDLLGFPGIKYSVPAADQKLGVTVKPAHKSTYAYGVFAALRKEAKP
jgi:gluconate 2-dehydrogenase gamma chain